MQQNGKEKGKEKLQNEIGYAREDICFDIYNYRLRCSLT